MGRLPGFQNSLIVTCVSLFCVLLFVGGGFAL